MEAKKYKQRKQSYADKVKHDRRNNENNASNRHTFNNRYQNQLNEYNNNETYYYNENNYGNYEQRNYDSHYNNNQSNSMDNTNPMCNNNDNNNRPHQPTHHTNYNNNQSYSNSVDNTNYMHNNNNNRNNRNNNNNNQSYANNTDNTSHIYNNNNNNYRLDNPSEEYKVYNEQSNTQPYNSYENKNNSIDNNEYKNNENRNNNYHRSTNNNQNNYQQSPNNYHSNNNTQNNVRRTGYINYYEKYAHCPLSFEDQIYLTFKNSQYESLHFDQICQELLSKYNTKGVRHRDMIHVRFLYQTEKTNQYRMYLRYDDICPNGYECPMDRRRCSRIHCASIAHICPRFDFNSMRCADNECKLIHIPPRKMTTIISEIIFRIYKKHSIINSKHNKPTLMFKYHIIEDHEFINTYTEFYGWKPLPNITPRTWKRFIHNYNKFYFDYQQQLNDPASRRQYSFLNLWRTNWDENGKNWHISISQEPWFFSKRTCYYALLHSLGLRKYSCKFQPKWACPYFHFQSKHVTVEDICDCHSTGYQCDKWHIRMRADLQRPYPLPTSPWYRTKLQVNKEIDLQLKQMNTTNINIIDMDQNDMNLHSKWCSDLGSIFEKYQKNNHRTDDSEKNFQHTKREGIAIVCPSAMNRLKPLQMIDKLMKGYYYYFSQAIIDIHYVKIQKNIILKYKVVDISNICMYLAESITRQPMQWCFNRKISLKYNIECDYDTKETIMIFEFENVNLFLSIRLLKYWFMNVVRKYLGDIKYNKHFSNAHKFQFVSGNYYFLKTNKTSAYNAIAYFEGSPLNPETILRPSIDNIEIELKYIPCDRDDEDSSNIHSDESHFIDYKKPQVYFYLKKCNNNTVSSIQTVDNQQPQQQQPQPRPQLIKPQRPSPPRHAPQVMQSPIQNNLVTNYDYDTESSSVSQSPLNNQQPILSNVPPQNNDEYDYSDTSSESMNAEEEKWEPQWPKCDVKDCNYCKPLPKNETVEVNLSQLWVERHRKYGNAYKGNENLKIYPVEEEERYCHVHNSDKCKHRINAFKKLNNLCRYCQLDQWSDEHKQECWFIPNFVKEGKDEADEAIKNETTFVGFRRRG